LAKVLVVDDDQALANNIADWLKHDGHTVDVVSSGEDALQLSMFNKYAVLILDWALPGVSGYDVCREYRKSGGEGWTIFLTGKSAVPDKEAGLDVGGDDYLVKPIDLRELSARVRSGLRRAHLDFQRDLKVGDCVLNLGEQSLSNEVNSVTLTSLECSLLELLFRNEDTYFTAEALIAAVWPSNEAVSTGSVRMMMLRIREKLAKLGRENLIQSRRHSGYCISSKP